MDSSRHRKTVPIRKRQAESSSYNSADVEGTFIPVTEFLRNSFDFINAKFTEDENDDDEEIEVVDLQTEERLPLFLLFPDLCAADKERLKSSTSTTQVARILKGKKADFSLLKASKKLNPEQGKLPPVYEDAREPTDGEEPAIASIAAPSGGELINN